MVKMGEKIQLLVGGKLGHLLNECNLEEKHMLGDMNGLMETRQENAEK